MTEYVGPVHLQPEHDVSRFDCGEPALNEWLRRRGVRNERSGASRTWAVLAEGNVVAFYASSAAVLLRSSATSRAARNQPEPIPALLLGRLAVDRAHQGRGLAAALLKHFLLKALEVAEITGVRLVLVHAKSSEAREFYVRFGFEASPMDDMTLMLLLHDVAA